MSVFLGDVELAGNRCDVTVADGIVESIHPAGSAARISGQRYIDGAGGALIRGLWDHHIHLLAAAAALASVRLADGDDFARKVQDGSSRLEPGSWLRVVGYHESMAGDIDRHDLDRVVSDRPVRVQHRSGARWILNSPACLAAGLDDADHAGVERMDDGTATGRVTGADDWLRSRVGHPVSGTLRPGALRPLANALLAAGVTGVTDAGPDTDTARWNLIAEAVSDGTFPLRVCVTGGPDLVGVDPPSPLVAGPVKLYLADHSLPDLDSVVDWICKAHDHGRPVAFHSVTRTSLAMVLASLDAAGSIDGDRIEHGSVISPDAFDSLRRHGVCIVTQPGFIAERGDVYLRDVDDDDIEHLYRCASLQAAGIPVGGSTDAPYTDHDPWASITAAIQRRTRTGRVIGAGERLSPVDALDLFLSDPSTPGGPPRRVEVGAPADLCLLESPLDRVLADPSAERVRATVIGGDVAYER